MMYIGQFFACVAIAIAFQTNSVKGAPLSDEERSLLISLLKSDVMERGKKDVFLVSDAVAQKECVAAHNAIRKQHDATPIQWSPDVEQGTAAAWAEKLATTGKLAHSKTSWGENLAMAGYSGTVPEGACQKAVQMWAAEEKDYSIKNPGYSPATGHFTQVVWKASTKLHCAIAYNADNWFTVCRYYLPGNYQGEFQQNVE